LDLQLPKIYPITDTRLSGLSHLQQLRRLTAGGAQLVQLREKAASSKEFFYAASEAVSFSKQNGVRLIINDRADIAMTLGADGVHLGQGDLPPAEARALVGADAIIGFSTHSICQATAALDQPIDYLAFGPIFRTASKNNPDPIVGLDALEQVCRLAGPLPVVAIGGIDAANLTSVFAAGAASAAMIGAFISDAMSIEKLFREHNWV
jgi:thiamine-phosphate pyrophosphorylase